MIGVHHYLTLSAVLFVIGLYGLLTRRNLLLVLLSVELMLNAANISFTAFSSYSAHLEGQIIVFFTMIVAACEVTVGLAVVILLYRKRNTTDIDALKELKW